MKYLIIHNQYSAVGGEERVVEAQIKLLTNANHTVETYIRKHEEMKSWRFGRLQSLFTALYSPRSRREIKDIITLFKPDVAIVHNLYPIISPAILPVLKKHGVRTIMTVHNYRLACPTGLFLRNGLVCEKCGGRNRELNCVLHKCENSITGSIAFALRNYWARKKKYYTKNIAKFLTLSKFQALKLNKIGIPQSKTTVVPNFIFTRKNNIYYPSPDNSYVGFAGRLSFEKGAHVLCEIATKLYNIKFKIAGDIPPNLNLKLPPNVELIGMLSENEMGQFYQNSSLMISTSICYEGFSMVALEASANGRVFVAPNTGAFPDIVSEKCLYEMGNTNEAAGIIENLMNNTPLRHQIEVNAKNHTTTHYNEHTYLELINKASH